MYRFSECDKSTAIGFACWDQYDHQGAPFSTFQTGDTVCVSMLRATAESHRSHDQSSGQIMSLNMKREIIHIKAILDQIQKPDRKQHRCASRRSQWNVHFYCEGKSFFLLPPDRVFGSRDATRRAEDGGAHYLTHFIIYSQHFIQRRRIRSREFFIFFLLFFTPFVTEDKATDFFVCPAGTTESSRPLRFSSAQRVTIKQSWNINKPDDGINKKGL